MLLYCTQLKTAISSGMGREGPSIKPQSKEPGFFEKPGFLMVMHDFRVLCYLHQWGGCRALLEYFYSVCFKGIVATAWVFDLLLTAKTEDINLGNTMQITVLTRVNKRPSDKPILDSPFSEKCLYSIVEQNIKNEISTGF